MPAKASTRLPASDAMNAASGAEPGAEHRQRALARFVHHARPGALADHDQRLRAIKLRAERRAQRPGRNGPAVADAPPAIDDKNGEILGQRRILKSVIHDDDGRPRRHCRLRTLRAITRHDGRRRTRQQQRLVADIGGAMLQRIDPHRAGEPPAIAAREEDRCFTGGREHARDGQRRRCLAGATDGWIADADDRHAGAHAVSSQPMGSHRAIDRRQRRQHRGGGAALPPPERWLTHDCCGARAGSA